MSGSRLSRGRTRWAWGVLSFLLWIATLLTFAFFASPYAALKPIADRFSRDGNAKPFTPELTAAARPFAGGAALIFLGLALFFLIRRETVLAWLERLLGWAGRQLRLTARDALAFFHDVRGVQLARGELLLLLAITLIGTWLRLVWIHFPMRYDEAYTYFAFASQPLWKVVSDYHLPNNHVFHTLLVHIATRLVGSIQPWAVRLPTFLAGVLAIPGTYFLARRLYGRPAAVISACLVAGVNFLVMFSANARGYMLMALLTLLAFLAGTYLLRHKNRLVWFGLAGICALGFFTVPIMLYPFGGLMAWLLVSALAGDLGPDYRSRWDFLRYWAAAGVAAGLLTLLLYTPILIASGPKSLFANQFVSAVPWDQFPDRMQNGWRATWIVWMEQVPTALQVILTAAFGAGLLFQRKISAYKIPIQIPLIAWIALVLVIQHSDTFPKLWVFLETLFFMGSGAGLAALAGLVRIPARLRFSAASLAAGLALAVLCFFPLRESFTRPLQLSPDREAARTTMEHLSAVIQPGDMIVVDIPVDAPIQYYAMVVGIPQSYFYVPKQGDRPFKRAFLVVAPGYQQTPISVLERRTLKPANFDLAASHTESDFGSYRVYRVLPAAMGQ